MDGRGATDTLTALTSRKSRRQRAREAKLEQVKHAREALRSMLPVKAEELIAEWIADLDEAVDESQEVVTAGTVAAGLVPRLKSSRS